MSEQLPIARFFFHEQVSLNPFDPEDDGAIRNHLIEFRPTSMEQGRHLVEAFFEGEGDTSVDCETGRFYAPDLFPDELIVTVE